MTDAVAGLDAMARRASSFAHRSLELALATPAVVGHRVARMALAGAAPSRRDRAEFSLMVSEKTTAFASAWQAMSAEALVAGQVLAVAHLRWWSASASGRPGPLAAPAAAWNRAVLGVLDKGLAPIHRTALANAKRLAKARRR